MAVTLTGSGLTIEEVVRIARSGEEVRIDQQAHERLEASRAFVDELVREERVVYGVTTGFGPFKDVFIGNGQTRELQENLIRSHATGVGEPLSEEQVRAMIVVRVNSLLQGYSGVRPLVVERLVDLLNKNVYPFVPCKGSVGSSGDLAPLSHLVLVLMGEGEVIVDGRRTPSRPALRSLDIEPISLMAKEGLALNNGTACQAAIGVLTLYDACQLAKVFDVSLAMSLEVLMGTLAAYEERVHALRPHPGQIDSATNVRALCADSAMMESHKDCGRVQDAYSLRCAPQVHGASRTALRHVREVLEREINSVTDNPLLFAKDGQAVSAGHFHGEPVAQVMDYLKIAVCELANISERRIARLVDVHLSEGLPPFLIPKEQGGLSSGYMIPQYVAAALVSENKVLAHPASVDSIPTSANQEDHVSMGTIAARQANEIVQNGYQVAAIELMCAAQGADLRAPLTLGRGTTAAHAFIRSVIPTLSCDRVLYTDLEQVRSLLPVRLLEVVQRALGKNLS